MAAHHNQKKKKKKDDESVLEVVFGEFIAPFFEGCVINIILFIPRMVVRLCRFIFD
jgi:hypothetical protein